jgi:hypothetical protein
MLPKSTTRKIPLSQGEYAIIDADDYAHLSQFRWWVDRRYYAAYAYRQEKRDGKIRKIYMHREILNAPKGIKVDHQNRNGLDNRRENIRFCTNAQNAMNINIHVDNQVGFKGVIYDRRKYRKHWVARIVASGKQIHLGSFRDPKDAARCYDKAAKIHFGQYAKTNEELGLL